MCRWKTNSLYNKWHRTLPVQEEASYNSSSLLPKFLYRTVCYVVITCYTADRSDVSWLYLWNMWQIITEAAWGVTCDYFKPAVPILFASRSTFQDRNSSRSTIVALKPKEIRCIFGCFYLTIFFKLLVFYRIARSRIIFRILNSLLMTAVLTMEGI